MQGFLGATESGKLAEAERAGSGLQCEQYFKGNCPWEPAAVTTIIMKLMVNYFSLNSRSPACL